MIENVSEGLLLYKNFKGCSDSRKKQISGDTSIAYPFFVKNMKIGPSFSLSTMEVLCKMKYFHI